MGSWGHNWADPCRWGGVEQTPSSTCTQLPLGTSPQTLRLVPPALPGHPS